MSPVTLVVVLALFLTFAGWVGILVGRAVRDSADDREAAGTVLVLAVIFAVIALLAIEFALPRLEELLDLV